MIFAIVVHRIWQEGTVVAVNGSAVKVALDAVGEKTIGMSKIVVDCKIEKNS